MQFVQPVRLARGARRARARAAASGGAARALVGLSALIVILLSPRLAWAGRVLIDLALDIEARDRPTDLCVITPFGQKGKHKKIEDDKDCQSPKKPPPSATADGKSRAAVLETCGGAGYCEPACELPASGGAGAPKGAARQYYVVCIHNDFEFGDDSRKLYVLLDLQKDETLRHAIGGGGPATALKLAGNTATVTVDSRLTSTEFEKERFQAKVVGGNYLPRDTVFSRDRLLVLKLVPRCGDHVVALPPGFWYEASTRLILPGGQAIALDAKDPARAIKERKVSARVPYGCEGRPKELQAVVSPAGEGRGGATYVARWNAAVPPPVIDVSPVEISFVWHKHVLYSSAICPTVKLEQTGGECESVGNTLAECAYHCPGDDSPGGVLLDMPAKLLFRHADFEDGWSAAISHHGQRVGGYVPPAERRVVLDFDGWGDEATWRDHAIDWVEVISPSGTVRVAPRRGARVAVPGLERDSVLSYTYVGKRVYRRRDQSVVLGKLSLDPPGNVEKKAFLALVLGGGGAGRFPENNPSDPAAQGAASGFPYGALTLAAGMRDVAPNIRLEQRFTALLGEQRYQILSGPEAPPDARAVPYARALIELAGWLSAPGVDYTTGLGAGVSIGTPMSRADEPLVGRAQPAFTGFLGMQLFPYSTLSVELRVRFTLGERLLRFSTDYRGSPDHLTLDHHWGGVELGIRADTFALLP